MTRLLLITSFVVIIDRLTKYYSLNNLSEARSVEVIPGLFNLTLVLNTGSAFGLFRNANAFFITLSILVIAAIAVYMLRRKDKDLFLIMALGLILGGATGNLIDRIAFGWVIDFLDFRVWPVFNIADSCITAGAILLAIRILFDKRCCTI